MSAQIKTVLLKYFIYNFLFQVSVDEFYKS